MSLVLGTVLQSIGYLRMLCEYITYTIKKRKEVKKDGTKEDY